MTRVPNLPKSREGTRQRSPPPGKMRAPEQAADAAAEAARADAARLEAELADAAAEVERLTSAVLANNDDTASACAEAEAL